MGFIDPFRVANYLEGRPVFRWEFVSENGGLCSSSNGASIMTQSVESVQGILPQIVIVSASWTPEVHSTQRLLYMLRDWARRGVTMGGLDTGAFVLAQAGLLKGRSATVHYEHIDSFRELYPTTEVTESLYVFDEGRITCCGGAAAVDFGLQVLVGTHGAALANAAARYIFQSEMRGRGTRQQPERVEPLGAAVPSIIKLIIQTMEDHLEDPLTIPQVCQSVGLSQRQVGRLFGLHIKKTPTLYYRDIRLDRARGLVTQTEMAMSEISVACGFSSQVHFSRAYKDRFGLPPIRDRIDGRVPFEFRAWPMHRKPK